MEVGNPTDLTKLTNQGLHFTMRGRVPAGAALLARLNHPALTSLLTRLTDTAAKRRLSSLAAAVAAAALGACYLSTARRPALAWVAAADLDDDDVDGDHGARRRAPPVGALADRCATLRRRFWPHAAAALGGGTLGTALLGGHMSLALGALLAGEASNR